jgi:hypothetical protein
VAVVVAVEEEEEVLNMFCVEVEEEEEVLNMPELWRNMALMSPTHSLVHEYEDFDVQFQDEEVSLWNF